MRRLFVLLSLSTLTAVTAVGAGACGENEKPPLTPDMVEPMPTTDGTDAGAHRTPTTTTTPKSPPPG